MFAFKKKSVRELNDEYFKNQYKDLVEGFIACESKWYKLDKKESIKIVTKNFNSWVDDIVNYLLNTYPATDINCNISEFDVSNYAPLDFKDLQNNVCSEAILMLVKPVAMPDMLYLGDRNNVCTCPCIYFNKGVIYSAENMEKFENLNNELKKEKFNNLFVGLDVFEVKALLDQMNVLPTENELDEYLEMYKNLLTKYNIFVKAIINKLIINGGLNYGVKRALILVTALGFDFDFSWCLTNDDIMYKKLKRSNCE